MTLPVYLESGAKRVFASALEWPGWSRSGRDEGTAIEAMLDHGRRYADAIAPLAANLVLPAGVDDVEIVERLRGGSGTDFGAPSVPPSLDHRPLAGDEARRWIAILEVAWTAFDEAATAAVGRTLATGPRGGGRSLAKIVRHVWESDAAYHVSLGHPYRLGRDLEPVTDMLRLRVSAIAALRSRLAGEPLPPSRRTSPPWEPREYLRRAAWHALDHAWELEDRSGMVPNGP